MNRGAFDDAGQGPVDLLDHRRQVGGRHRIVAHIRGDDVRGHLDDLRFIGHEGCPLAAGRKRERFDAFLTESTNSSPTNSMSVSVTA